MQQSERIADYLEKAVPRMVSAKKYEKIRDELLSHILDKADFYIEIGYGKDDAYEKALEEMGEPQQVSTQFEEVYREKKIYSRITFFAIILVDIFTAILGFGISLVSWFFDGVMLSSVESLVISSVFLCAVLLIVIYAYKEKHTAMLKAVGLAHIFLSVPMLSGSIYLPVVIHILQLGLYDNYSLLGIFSPLLITVPIAIFSLIASSKKRASKRNSRISEKYFVFASAFIIIITLFLCSSAILSISIPIENEYLDFDYSLIQEHTDSKKEVSEITELYDSITKNTTYNEADRILYEAGFIPHTELDTVITDEGKLLNIYDSIKNYLSDNLDNETVYLKLFESGYVSAYEPSFVISKTDDKPIDYKKVYFFERSLQIDIITFFKQILLNIEYTQEAREVFESFCLDDSKDIVLKRIRRICTVNSLKTEYTEKGVVETYTLDTLDRTGAIFDEVSSSFEGTLVFRNNCLIDGNYVYEHYEYYAGEEPNEILIEYVIEK